MTRTMAAITSTRTAQVILMQFGPTTITPMAICVRRSSMTRIIPGIILVIEDRRTHIAIGVIVVGPNCIKITCAVRVDVIAAIVRVIKDRGAYLAGG